MDLLLQFLEHLLLMLVVEVVDLLVLAEPQYLELEDLVVEEMVELLFLDLPQL